MSRKRKSQSQDLTRRDFLWKNACAALTAAGMASTIYDLKLINAAAADNVRHQRSTAKTGLSTTGGTAPLAYKALVCIFLFGGNDGNNLLVPTDVGTYTQYVNNRGVLAIPQPGVTNGLLPLNYSDVNHTGYGIHPSMPEIQALFNSGQAALLANVGSLLAPLTRTQYLNRSVATPPQLFSHSDQQLEWQTSIDDQAPVTGWGGRSADLLYSLNSSNNVSMNISLAGANTFQTGKTISAYNVSSSGAVSLNSSSQLATLQALLNQSHTNLYESAFATEMNTALNDASLINTNIAATSSSTYWNPNPFPNTGIGNQLKMIARLIQAAPAFGHQRQIFFASMGGFDLHGSEGNYMGSQANLLQQLSQGMNALYKATVKMGLGPNVLQFTASDFSRTFPVNSIQGADHGWGNNHLMVGGSLNGQKIYGTYPQLVLNGPDDTNTGRWIPSTSVDQYSATIAKWFGVSPSNISTVFPYIGRFATPDLGFMQSN